MICPVDDKGVNAVVVSNAEAGLDIVAWQRLSEKQNVEGERNFALHERQQSRACSLAVGDFVCRRSAQSADEWRYLESFDPVVRELIEGSGGFDYDPRERYLQHGDAFSLAGHYAAEYDSALVEGPMKPQHRSVVQEMHQLACRELRT